MADKQLCEGCGRWIGVKLDGELYAHKCEPVHDDEHDHSECDDHDHESDASENEFSIEFKCSESQLNDNLWEHENIRMATVRADKQGYELTETPKRDSVRREGVWAYVMYKAKSK